MSTLIPVTDLAVLQSLSPYNWATTGNFITAVNAGAYVKMKFGGTSFGVNINTTGMMSQSYSGILYPVIQWVIDGGAPTGYQLQSGDSVVTCVTGLSNTTHSIKLTLQSSEQWAWTDRWTPYEALVINNFILDSGNFITPGAKQLAGNMIAFGDSITEGAAMTGPLNAGNTNTPLIGNATLSYIQYIANYLQLEIGFCAFAGQSIGGGTNVDNVPGLTGSYNYIYNNLPRVFSPAPYLATINIGTNGSTSESDYTSLLTSVRSACGSGCLIFCIVPFTNPGLFATISQGIFYYLVANPSDTNIALWNGGNNANNIVGGNSYNYPHPNIAGHALLGSLIETGIPFVSPNYVLRRAGGHLRFAVRSFY